MPGTQAHSVHTMSRSAPRNKFAGANVTKRVVGKRRPDVGRRMLRPGEAGTGRQNEQRHRHEPRPKPATPERFTDPADPGGGRRAGGPWLRVPALAWSCRSPLARSWSFSRVEAAFASGRSRVGRL